MSPVNSQCQQSGGSLVGQIRVRQEGASPLSPVLALLHLLGVSSPGLQMKKLPSLYGSRVAQSVLVCV